MPGPITFFSLGAAGATAYYVNRRNSMTSDTSPVDNANMTPIQVARRRSSTVIPDHDWPAHKQAEYLWRRNNGASFSHNSEPKYPTSLQNKDLQQTSK
ncbi:uncharacterized protein B0P05DRAFT_463113 [Gilbertella persicaria]|uniref:Uncharacterized protein n=1 Tax=Rhizopus stolonifer TaxID=4846 RepID=A0A367K2L0_RHIST|nr:uncharacterized protein B0P05DRAFT_463113 [Gilbertella persicaria]KAI8091339.1 hypothetical protein B0P05DRAFT_463113 [Gilbertella persicaria]RCH96397.1 hypothetical protein CU098_009098 [Rhizopus stolonifer]